LFEVARHRLSPAVLRWVWLGLLALTELVWLSMRFDFYPLSGKAIWWAEWVSHANMFASIVLASLAAGVVVGWARARGRLREGLKFRDLSYKSWLLVLAQLTAFAVFSWLSIIVAENNVESSNFADLWILAWAAAGLGAGIFWLLAAMPARAWLRLARQEWVVVLAGLMIGAAAWILGLLAGMAWGPLRGPTFLLVQWLLEVFGQDVVSQPANYVLGTQQFSVAISPVCSGYAGIGLMVVFVGAYLWLFRRRLRFPQAFFLLPCAILIIWLVNGLRIASLIMFGTHVSPEIALGGFHSQVGWLGFIAVALSMVAVTQRMPFFAVRQSKVKTKVREGDPTAAYLAPLMALLAIIMVTGVFSSGFDWFYPVRVLGTAAAIWFCWPSIMTRLHFANVWSGSAIGIGVAVFVIWMGLEWAMGNTDTGPAIPNSLEKMPACFAAAWLIFRVLGSVIMVPIAEELAFRGYLLRRLISADFDKVSPRFTWLSFLLSSLLFGALHGCWLAGTVAGMFYAWAMYRRGKVGDAILAHATTNALIAADVLILGNWKLWN
jgi:exosortase E/protease (VPEID-CTERM system)